MLRVLSDALTADHDRQVTLITLVDLPSAFDCVDHELLLHRLQYNFDFTDDVLCWITSFVSDRTQQVSYDGQLSPIRPVQFRVPHGSVLGPLLFVLYTADLNKIIASHRLQLHQYADDCQVCATTSVDDVELAIDRLAGCVADVGAWTTSSRLRLNSSKTQVMWPGHKNQIDKINISSVPCSRLPSASSTAHVILVL